MQLHNSDRPNYRTYWTGLIVVGLACWHWSTQPSIPPGYR